MDIKETIDKKITFNPRRIYQLIVRQLGKDINGLSEPCYKVHTKVLETTIFRELKITSREWNMLGREISKVKPGAGDTVKVPFTVALSYLYYRYIKAGERRMAQDILLYLLVKFYGSRFHKHLPAGCHDETFRYTLENLAKPHLFYKYKTIANSLIYLSDVINKKFITRMKTPEIDMLVVYDFIIESVNRVAQSSRSFFQSYYRNREAGKGIAIEVTPDDDAENKNMFQTTTGSDRRLAATEKFIKSMFVYKNHDKKAIDESKRISRVKNNLAEIIIPMIHDKKSEEPIKLILMSFLKEILDTNSLCGNDFYKIVKRLMLKRNFKDTFRFRALVTNFTNSMYENVSTLQTASERDKISLSIFVSFYITISFRNLFC
jgi:hypothetical protein